MVKTTFILCYSGKMSRILSAGKRGEGTRLRGQGIDLSEFAYKPKKY